MLPTPSRVAADLLRVLPRKRISRAIGRVADVRAPSALLSGAIDLYARALDVDLSEAAVPDGGFRSFDAFFTRSLKPGARPIDADPSVLVSPADGRLEDAGPIERGATLRVKGRLYDVAELLGDTADARAFDGGAFAVVYLSPRDYHRVHSPVTGSIETVRYVGGTLFPVNDIGVRHVDRLFARNERVAVVHRSERHGAVATILVGAVGVGRITISFEPDVVTNRDRAPRTLRYGERGPRLERGDELGMFHLGSTVIVFVGPTVPLTFTRLPGDAVRVGEALARATGAA